MGAVVIRVSLVTEGGEEGEKKSMKERSS